MDIFASFNWYSKTSLGSGTIIVSMQEIRNESDLRELTRKAHETLKKTTNSEIVSLVIMNFQYLNKADNQTAINHEEYKALLIMANGMASDLEESLGGRVDYAFIKERLNYYNTELSELNEKEEHRKTKNN